MNMRHKYVINVIAFIWTFFFKKIITDDLLSSHTIRNMIKNTHLMNDSKNFNNFSFFYLYNALRCTLTENVFESYEDEKYQKEIHVIKKNLLELKKQTENKNLWLFFEFNLFDSLILSDIENNMRNYGIGLSEIFNELKLLNSRFSHVVDYKLNICTGKIFDVEVVSLFLAIVPFLLDKLDITYKDYIGEFSYELQKTLNFFNFFVSLVNKHNTNIVDIDKKEINVFLKVKDNFHLSASREEKRLSLYDEISLKNKYGKLLISDLFKLFDKIYFFEVEEELNYFDYIEIFPIYVKIENELFKSRNYNMENMFYSLIETFKKDLEVNEGIIMIKIFKQYKIHVDTKRTYYFDSDIIYKTIMHKIHKSTSILSDTKFNFLYSQNIDNTKRKISNEDITLSLIILIDSNIKDDDLLETFYQIVFSKDIFLSNKEINKHRIKVVGSCIYTKEKQPPIFHGFFSHGLSTYILFKILDLLKPNKKLLYLSIEKAEDNNQIKAEGIAERILNNSGESFEIVLLFERDEIINYDKFEYNEKCDMCLMGYGDLYALYLCIFIPIILSLLTCYFIYKKKKNAKRNSVNNKIHSLRSEIKSIEPNIISLK
ncbi:conserved Plasmodium protein, unknown function [Plasmodium gallinaceum]|uniref:Uncharacterized protein n=1 Tax=Plasmodium gallinaceum TaxID=5849 RepID=A0A1J1H1Y4_PLAGA|nr:conserved Plasmodium protein, unknown function [Plasmodium gallinaceum]CRG97334.1 conserved Plasmodium protein, unknown function [Plasmodium gallinaceum]